MRRGHLTSVILVCIVCLGSFAGVVALNWKPLLGLDLRGGLSVVYCPAAPKSTTTCATGKNVSKAKLNTVVSILSNRANAYGVSQPNINVQGNDVVVQLPGVKDANAKLKALGSTAQLYFRPVLCYADPYTGPATTTTTTTTSPSTTTTTVAKGKSGTTTTTKATTTTTAATTTTTTTKSTKSKSKSKAKSKAKSTPYVTPPLCPSTYKPTSTNTGGTPYPPLANYQTTPIALDLPSKTVLLPLQGSTDRMELGPSEASGEVISSATPTYEAQGGWIIQFSLSKSGCPIWDALATKNYHSLVADDLGGSIISAPVIDATGSQFGCSGQVTGSFTQQSANALAINLNYGALPVTLVKVTSEVVSPSLGATSLHAGLLAGLLGLVLVMLYTILYYRALGVVVVLGLLTTAALIYAIISALGHSSFQLTLDLSGITGLIVSVGITVDSYVVYFERLKDEVRAGRSIRASVDRGFKSAYRTILSADAVSFIGALVLWWLSVGAVRGFAFMLGLSTIIDVITAYFFTRPLVILLGRNRIFTEARHLGVARGLAATASSEAGA
ncbi:MAG: protein translocase subunit SecD [Acidimicrobiales bacterium]